MNRLFITGHGRSGTTLLTNILTSHKDIQILMQPFPLLFVKLKSDFLKKLGKNPYYVLNDNPFNNDYLLNDFLKFLESVNLKQDEITKTFLQMENYSGQITKVKFPKKNFWPGIMNLFDSALKPYLRKNLKYFGSKEIFCEEFVPFFLKNGTKILVIIRDPRDIVASINYPKKKSYLGEKKPLLFIVKSWRRSVHFLNFYQSNNNFHYLKYEDLILNTDIELQKISNFLNISRFDSELLRHVIKDMKNNLIFSNSSHDNSSFKISQNSLGSYLNLLSNKEIKFIESSCYKEMRFLNYNLLNKPEAENITQFNENNLSSTDESYILNNENILSEINYFKKEYIL